VLKVTSGPSSDIQSATHQLYEALYELGFDPDGATVDRRFAMGMPYANYEGIPHELAEKLGLVLREMENFMVKDLLDAHEQDWYVEKIVALAKAGRMTEKEFYELIGYRHVGATKESLGTQHFQKLFADYIVPESRLQKRAVNGKTRAQSTSVGENREAYMKEFSKVLKKQFHPRQNPQVKEAVESLCAKLLQ